jgi:hypothetical protein
VILDHIAVAEYLFLSHDRLAASRVVIQFNRAAWADTDVIDWHQAKIGGIDIIDALFARDRACKDYSIKVCEGMLQFGQFAVGMAANNVEEDVLTTPREFGKAAEDLIYAMPNTDASCKEKYNIFRRNIHTPAYKGAISRLKSLGIGAIV